MRNLSLVNRVSAFFLAALAVSLAGYSVALFVIVRQHLYGQFDDGLQNALRILSASVEVENDDAKWQPGEFAVDLSALGDVTWIVGDDQGQMIDHSPGWSRSDPADAAVLDYSARNHVASSLPVTIGAWRVLQRQLNAREPKPAVLREPHEYAGIRITVARSTVQLQGQMRQLVLLVCALPVAVWAVAAIAGRLLFRHALRPLRAMAARAKSMKSADFDLRLPIAPANDELADLGIAFNDLLERLQRAFQREHSFTGNAAHQLRTPLTVLKGQIEVALRRPRSADEYAQSLEVLAEQVIELEQIVEGLLFLARSEENAVPLDFEPLAVDEWAVNYLSRWDYHPRRQDLSVRIDAPTTLRTSPSLLCQIIDNLVSNALKYSEAGTPVVLAVRREQDRVVLAVEDKGAGIAAEERERLFEPFYRSRSARQTGVSGVGLGLAVAAHAAKVLRGSIECQSAPGKGSVFRVRLPVVPPIAPGEDKADFMGRSS